MSLRMRNLPVEVTVRIVRASLVPILRDFADQ